jgi:hypothetical protein
LLTNIQNVIIFVGQLKTKDMKYIIKLADGKFVEQFFKASICVTSDMKKAGKYTKGIAKKRLENLNITGELINEN